MRMASLAVLEVVVIAEADRDDDFTEVSPKLGLSYELNENHTLFARAQRGIRAPEDSIDYREAKPLQTWIPLSWIVMN